MPATTVDEYLAAVPEDKRAALQRLRQLIQAAAPDATEAISYGLPTFKLDGRWFVALGATKAGCSFHAGAAPIAALAAELGGYRVSKGAIAFKLERPLSDELVKKLVGVRLAEYRPG